ncbi:glycosyltransferase [Barnesiella sp. An55]|uniref:glycosyltransferase n=1 Tax=Barnesiella sp. An55 TaxID=1965646 RepID=UPI000B392B98|nr:glycosyltransferase [Barnesiella sp. An55]OUN73187.1 glycosyl transferase family 1 [Barnesiella sp. An55]
MNVLIVNTTDRNGGAAIAARRLGDALSRAGVEVTMLVLDKYGDDSRTFAVVPHWKGRLSFLFERLIIWVNNGFSRKNLFKVSTASTGFDITATDAFREADIVHLHWVNQGLLSLKSLDRIFRSGKPVVWTMHDMWECTSICHHAHGCNRFKSACHDCGFLRYPSQHDLAARVFRRKMEVFRPADVTWVAVSHWMARQARASALLAGKRVEVIPNTLSLSQFELLDRDESRRRLSLPRDKRIVLFGAVRVDDPIKGFPLLMEALRLLLERQEYRDRIHLVFFGRVKNPQEVYPLIPTSYTDAGWVDNPRQMSLLYSAADVAVSASSYETFGQTLAEAQACGCMPVSFGNSGQADIIRHGETGYLVPEHTAESLAEGIARALESGGNIPRERLRSEALSRYSEKTVARQYQQLYSELLIK